MRDDLSRPHSQSGLAGGSQHCLRICDKRWPRITCVGVLDEGVHFIQKPFSVEDLAAKVRETIDE
ncbi:MAG TPA: hypothetical protein DEO88_06280 [Syntrophobacteraceae bacterium]|nr:hypothetical protein [Syntrophobacteraceae bacterium]